jgi:hypothetical protein
VVGAVARNLRNACYRTRATIWAAIMLAVLAGAATRAPHAIASAGARAGRCPAFTATSLDRKGHLRTTRYVLVTAKGVSCAAARKLLHRVGRKTVAGTKLITVGSYQCRLTVIASGSSGSCFNKGSQPGLSPRQVTWAAVFLH